MAPSWTSLVNRGQPVAATTHTMSYVGGCEHPRTYGIVYGAVTPYWEGPYFGTRHLRPLNAQNHPVRQGIHMNPRAKVRRAPEWQVWTALLIVYIVWGSTYLAIRVVDETMPPLLAAGLRHSVAGLIIFALLAVTRGVNALRLGRADWLGAGFVGLCLLLGGNG